MRKWNKKSPHLVHLSRVAVQTERNLADVGDDGFASIALALQLAEDRGHFVAVLGIIHLFENRGTKRRGF
jgi:hypothetical protein